MWRVASERSGALGQHAKLAREPALARLRLPSHNILIALIILPKFATVSSALARLDPGLRPAHQGFVSNDAHTS
jgi:hypothetical protein